MHIFGERNKTHTHTHAHTHSSTFGRNHTCKKNHKYIQLACPDLRCRRRYICYIGQILYSHNFKSGACQSSHKHCACDTLIFHQNHPHTIASLLHTPIKNMYMHDYIKTKVTKKLNNKELILWCSSTLLLLAVRLSLHRNA